MLGAEGCVCGGKLSQCKDYVHVELSTCMLRGLWAIRADCSVTFDVMLHVVSDCSCSDWGPGWLGPGSTA